MLALNNHTRYSAAIVPCWNEEGHEIALTLIKATYRWDAAGTLVLDDAQAPVRFAGRRYSGEPGQSSVRFESDLAFFKPQADVIINGSAHAPRGRRVEQLEVLARVGSASKRLRVTGDRSRGIGSATAPFESMPIRYERAAGSDWLIPSEDTSQIRTPRAAICCRTSNQATVPREAAAVGRCQRDWWIARTSCPALPTPALTIAVGRKNGCRFCRSILIADFFKQRRMDDHPISRRRRTRRIGESYR